MQHKLLLGLSFPVVGLVLSLGVATAAHAADVPNYDQLYTQTRTDAQNQVNAALNPTPTPTPTPSVSPTVSNGTAPSSDTNVIVLNTGDNAKLDTSVDNNSSTSVTNNNNATVNQTVNGSANSGDNTADRNISFGGNAGTIQTGDASVNSSLGASVNSNTTRISGSCPDVTSNVTVYNTGDNLNQNSGTSNTCTTTVTNNNNATINQAVNGSANSGNNSATRNISIGGSAGQILTGNASVGSLEVAQGNQNVVVVGGQSSNGGPGSGANIYILNTGDGAVLLDRRRFSSSVDVTNNNSFNSNQIVNASADTGNNAADRNINQNGDAGVIQTGDATVNTALVANANSNNTAISGSGGNATTNVNLINTGDNLVSDNSASVDNTTTVTNNNTANINQEVNATADTGHNDASRNIAFGGDAGVIRTGDATVNTALSANANQNYTAISGAEGAANTNVNVLNTGDNPVVNADTSTSNQVTVTNNNVANVNQVANVNANTGYNEANRNIGGGSITTGGVTVNTLAVDHANGNYTFIVDSSSTAQSVFNQFVQSLFGMSLDDILANQGSVVAGTPVQGNSDVNLTNTGDNGVVLAQNSTVRRVVVTNNNTSDINQFVNVNANTGNNQCNRNIGGCDIVTGDVVVNTTLLANSNFNFTVIGKVEMPSTPVTPETPQTPSTPSTPTGTEAVEASQTLAPAPSSPAVLAAVTSANLPASGVLPETGAQDYAALGLLLVVSGFALRRKTQSAEAEVK